jgi:hypothetical protein
MEAAMSRIPTSLILEVLLIVLALMVIVWFYNAHFSVH